MCNCSGDTLIGVSSRRTPSFIYFRAHCHPDWHSNTLHWSTERNISAAGACAELSWRQCTWLLSQSWVWKEAAGPLKAKMVSCKLQLLPSVSFLPFRDHRAFKIEPELTYTHTQREKASCTGTRGGFCINRGNWRTLRMVLLQRNEVAVTKTLPLIAK